MEVNRNFKLKNYKETHAKVIKVSIAGPRSYVDYQYHINGVIVVGSQSISKQHNRTFTDKQLKEIQDLKIRYSIEDPEVSEIIDERIK